MTLLRQAFRWKHALSNNWMLLLMEVKNEHVGKKNQTGYVIQDVVKRQTGVMNRQKPFCGHMRIMNSKRVKVWVEKDRNTPSVWRTVNNIIGVLHVALANINKYCLKFNLLQFIYCNSTSNINTWSACIQGNDDEIKSITLIIIFDYLHYMLRNN